jgi:hypothetical protein
VKRNQVLSVLVLALQAGCAGRPGAPATAPCKISVGKGGQVDVAGLPALSADGARVAVPEQCHARTEPACIGAIVLFSGDGKVQARVELAGRPVSEASLRHLNELLADGRFEPMAALQVPFSAYDLNLMTLEVGDIVINYRGDFSIDRGGYRLATLDLEPTGDCKQPLWIRSMFFDDKTHTLAVEFEYHNDAGCPDPHPVWRVLRFR